MKKFWNFWVEAEQWLEILIFTAILIGGGIYVIIELFLK